MIYLSRARLILVCVSIFIPSISFLALGQPPKPKLTSEEAEKEIARLTARLEAYEKGKNADLNNEEILKIHKKQVQETEIITKKLTSHANSLQNLRAETLKLIEADSSANAENLKSFKDKLDNAITDVDKRIKILEDALLAGKEEAEKMIQLQTEALPELTTQEKKLKAELGEFKAFTKILAVGYKGNDMLVTIYAEKNGEKKPLAHVPIQVSRQFMDGDPKPFSTVTTDENGQVIISRNGWRDVPKGHNLRFDFIGNKEYRPSSFRSRYR